ncbi:MAG TPA: 3-oxoacyl-[acyl-carrier-protein] reductase [Gaiellaceae bacterium]
MPDPYASLEGKRALITGAARGIGRAIAAQLKGAGAEVLCCDLPGTSENEEVAREVGGQALYADVTKTDDVEKLIAEAGEIDILINNAGITRDGLLARMSEEDWRAVIDVNLTSVYLMCRAAIRGMMKRRSGTIVNLSSVVGLHGNFGQTNYAASKAGIVGFTKSLAREAGTRGVRVNAVAPGYIETRLTDVLPEEVKTKMLEATSLGRFGQPEDIARAVHFLCSDEAAFITGEVLVVDGGMAM